MVTDGDGVGERTPTDMSVNNWFYRESTRSRHQKCHQDRNTVEEHSRGTQVCEFRPACATRA